MLAPPSAVCTSSATEPRDAAFAGLLFRYACDHRHGPACHELADLYYTGDGLPRDLERALYLYDGLCAEGFTTVCIVLGYFFEHGVGFAQDLHRARREYQRACEAGSIEGCHRERKLELP